MAHGGFGSMGPPFSRLAILPLREGKALRFLVFC